jgi:hypothetical protein
MPALFVALAAIYHSAAQCAAALGLTRQAYAQAIKRRRMSESAALRAAALLGIDPAVALLANATKTNPPDPISQPAANPTPDNQPAPQEPSQNTDAYALYYVK